MIRSFCLLSLFVSAACGADSGSTTPNCMASGSCDDGVGEAAPLCVERWNDAFNDNKEAFQETHLRWSCSDTRTVIGDERGQEYCEYFALVQIPEASEEGVVILPDETLILGRNLGTLPEHGTTPDGVELTPAQIKALEVDESQIVGQCVFTAWNSDQLGFLPVCDESGRCPDILGVELTPQNFAQTFEFNSNEAAHLLVEDCSQFPDAGDAANPNDPLHDPLFRACMLNAEINETPYRKSDTTICTAVTRLVECGCTLADEDADLGETLAPSSFLGFTLGTWSSPADLPPGCFYVEDGIGNDVIVTCDLSAADVLRGQRDLKGTCMDKYGDNVVVHVEMPSMDDVTCSPALASPQYASSCGEVPWMLTGEEAYDAEAYDADMAP